MATAEELMRNIALQPDPEGHIVVGGDRFITVPDNLKRLGVQYDHNMETVIFDCPRYWDKRDMSTMAVYINYELSNGYADKYPADNVRADGDLMHFEWTISRNVTQVPGTVAFLVCVMKTDSEGNEERHWNSELCSDCYVSKGMETEEHPALEHPDEISQLLGKMNYVEQLGDQVSSDLATAQDAADRAEQAHRNAELNADRADETLHTIYQSRDEIRNSYAPAVKGNVSGEIIRVDDVSPLTHDVTCQVHGKNLFGLTGRVESSFGNYYDNHRTFVGNALYVGMSSSNYYDTTNASYTYDEEAAQLTVTGDAWYGIGVDTRIKPNTTYVISGEISDNAVVGLAQFDATGNYIRGKAFTETTFTTEANACWGVILAIPTKTNTPATFTRLQIEEGSVATSYEPYVDPTTVSVIGCGKNLIDLDMMCNAALTKSDGQYKFKKGATSDERFSDVMPIYIPANTPVYISAIFGNYTVSDTSLYMIIKYDDGTEAFPGIRFSESGRLLNLTKNTTGIQFYIQGTEPAGAYLTFRNLQLEIGEAPTAYESYVNDSATPNADGTCTVTSKSPTMTLFTDTPGVIIEAEYNVDTAKFILANSGSGEGGGGNVDLTDYVKNTDYATADKGGVIRVYTMSATQRGIAITSEGYLSIKQATTQEIQGKTHLYAPLTPNNLDYAVKVALTTNTETLTAEEQAAAQAWLGLGNIEAALDGIITIQNSLIGGGSV